MISRDFTGGLALIAFAVVYALAASNLSMTSSLGIGSGLFPMMMAGLLALLGIAVTINAFRKRHEDGTDDDQTMVIAAPPVPLRGIVLVIAAPVVFALLVVPLGVAPALGLAVFVSALANRTTSLVAAIGVSLGLVLFCLAVFRWALGLPLQMFGPWLGF